MPRFPARIRRALPFALALLALAGCGDGNGPDPALRVTLSAAVDGAPTVERLPDGTPYLQCIVRLTAVPRGAHQGEWMGGTVRWYGGTERATPFDTLALDPAGLRAAWEPHNPLITPGETITARLLLAATVPFEAGITLRYKDRESGHLEQVHTEVLCGPDVAPDAAPPAITALDATVRDLPLEFGDTLQVSFTATSGATVWRSYVQLSGPCEVITEHVEPLTASATRTALVPIPSTCGADAPVTVTVGVLDGAGRSTVRTLETALRVRDVTPPTFDARFYRPMELGTSPVPRGAFYVGGNMVFEPIATDNADATRWIFWRVEPGGTRDSVRFTRNFEMLALPVTEAWRTADRLLLSARDSAGNESAPRSYSLRDGVVILPATVRPTTATTVAEAGNTIVVDARRDVVYVMQHTQSRIVAIDRASGAIVRTIPLLGSSDGFDLTAGGDSLVYSMMAERAIGVADLRTTPATSAVVPIAAIAGRTDGTQPRQVVALANGHVMAVTVNASGDNGIADVNLADGSSRLRTDVGTGGVLRFASVVRSLDHRVMIVRALERIWRFESAANAFTATISGNFPNVPPSLDEAGARMSIGAFLYDNRLALVRTAQAPATDAASYIGASVLSPDGQTLLYPVPGGIMRARTSDGALVDRIPLPVGPIAQLLPWPGSGRLLVRELTQGPPIKLVFVE